MSISQISGSAAYGSAGAAIAAPASGRSPAGVAPQSATQSPGVNGAEPSGERLAEAVSQLNKFVQPVAQSVSFSVDKESGQSIVRVVDSQTQQVLKQLPSQETLAIARNLNKLQGMLIHQEA